jgi:dTDP-4-dehydrorhamnose reductase
VFLIVGANSEIGSATANHIRARGGDVLATTRRATNDTAQLQLDLGSPIRNLEIPSGIKSACIFVAVARLAACEADPERSAWINVAQTISLVDLLVQRGIYVLFLSSNQVFRGDRAHVPPDASPSPVSEYGRQKAQVERLLADRIASGAPIGVLRLAKVVSPGMSLVAEWTKQLAAGQAIRAFADMMMAPVPVHIASAAIASMMEDRLPVIAQLSGPRDISYFDLGRFLADRAGADPRLVNPVSALENGMPEGSIPRHTTLDSSYLADRYGLVVPDALEVIGRL